jgi:hypothetical protein
LRLRRGLSFKVRSHPSGVYFCTRARIGAVKRKAVEGIKVEQNQWRRKEIKTKEKKSRGIGSDG